MGLWLIVGGLVLAYLFYHFFIYDVMNKIQYFQFLRVYWITKDNAPAFLPFCSWAFMRQTSEPYWYGKGVQFKLGKYSFQIGILQGKNEDFMEALMAEDLDVTVPEIRGWDRPE